MNYEVRMTMTVALTVNVEAENEEKAEKLAMEKTDSNEAYYLSKYDSVWEREIIEVNECEPDESDGMAEGLEYVRGQIGPVSRHYIRETVSKNLSQRMPASMGLDDGKIIDLLEEYGEDNDLPEGWWMNEGDIDDWLMKL